MNKKLCPGCGEVKPLDAFHVSKHTKNGRQSRCRVCRSHRSRTDNTPEALARRRAMRRASPDAHIESNRRYRETHKNNRKKPKDQGVAHTRVWSAIKRGAVLRQPCEVCGGHGVAHHDDYGRPLDIRWLCVQHHADWHRINGPGRDALAAHEEES